MVREALMLEVGMDWGLLIRSIFEIMAVLVSAGALIQTVRTTNQRLVEVVEKLDEIGKSIADIDKRLFAIEDWRKGLASQRHGG